MTHCTLELRTLAQSSPPRLSYLFIFPSTFIVEGLLNSWPYEGDFGRVGNVRNRPPRAGGAVVIVVVVPSLGTTWARTVDLMVISRTL